jgi:hypothetical protein
MRPGIASNIESVLARFLKTRPPLPEEYKKIHGMAYQTSRKGATFVHRLVLAVERWMHRTIARRNNGGVSILEIGAAL